MPPKFEVNFEMFWAELEAGDSEDFEGAGRASVFENLSFFPTFLTAFPSKASVSGSLDF